jgi:hypothetical protein
MGVRDECKGLEVSDKVRIYWSVRKERRVVGMRWWGRVRIPAIVMVVVGWLRLFGIKYWVNWIVGFSLILFLTTEIRLIPEQ